MKSIKLMASVLAISMIVSGLALVSGGSDSDEPVINSMGVIEPIEPKATVPRTILMEDFTSWQCPPCATFSPVLSSVVDSYGYTQIAPAMYHCWFPNYDDDPIYQNNPEPIHDLVSYYQPGPTIYVPWFLVDGVNYATSTTPATLEGYFDAALAIPANIALRSFIVSTFL